MIILAHIGVISSIALVIHNIVEGMAVYSTVLTRCYYWINVSYWNRIS